MGHGQRREEKNKEVMMKCDQDQKKKMMRHCLMDMKHKGCAIRLDSDGTLLGQWAVLMAGYVDDKLC